MNALSAFATDVFGAALLHVGIDVTSAASVRSQANTPAESMAFTHALVALTAKVAAVDSAPNTAEFQAFSALFADADRVSTPRLRSLFMKMVGDASSALQFARQLLAMTQGDHALHAEIIEKLLVIALADGALNALETNLLRSIAVVFGISGDTFSAIISRHPAQQSPYDVLGIAVDATADEVRERYLSRVQSLHPDRFQAAGASSDIVAQLSDQLAAVNAAYDEIKRLQTEKPSAQAQVNSWWRGKNTKGANAG